MRNVKAGATNLIDSANEMMKARAQEMVNAMSAVANTIQYGIAQTLGNAIYQGFAAAFSGKGISGLLKGFAKSILAGIGQTFTQLGQVYLQYGVLMQGLASFLPNPFTAGWAGVAIGAALIAMGAALGAVGTHSATAGSGGGYSAGLGYNNTQDQITRIRLMPGWAQGSDISPRSGNNYQFTVIGANDPQAQRAISELVRNAERRGL
jgi:hypothetical protein